MGTEGKTSTEQGDRDDRRPTGAGDLTAADLSPAERDVESALAGLRPVPPDGDRDELLRLTFRAGRAAAEADAARRDHRQLFAWRAAAAVLALALGASLVARPGQKTAERIVVRYQDRQRPGPDANLLVAVTPAMLQPVAPPDRPAEWAAGPPAPSGRPLVPSADSDYLVVRDAVLRLGVPVLPPPRGRQGAVAAASGPSVDELLGGTPRQSRQTGGTGVDLSKIKALLLPGDRL